MGRLARVNHSAIRTVTAISVTLTSSITRAHAAGANGGGPTDVANSNMPVSGVAKFACPAAIGNIPQRAQRNSCHSSHATIGTAGTYQGMGVVLKPFATTGTIATRRQAGTRTVVSLLKTAPHNKRLART